MMYLRLPVAHGLSLLTVVLLLGLAGCDNAPPAEMVKTSAPATTAAITPQPQPKPATATASDASPGWFDLSPQQRQALLPLGGEWDKLESNRKKKWLEIAARFEDMSPEERTRVHERMREWVKLTPAQRHTARDTYIRNKKLDSGKKSEKWEKYQLLTEEQKKRLLDNAPARKPVVNPPSALLTPPHKTPPDHPPAAVGNTAPATASQH